ncbi:hypothetical protein [Henriciella mobilis]|nr:hypothetical protein [Henriciella mobilis]
MKLVLLGLIAAGHWRSCEAGALRNVKSGLRRNENKRGDRNRNFGALLRY